MAYSPSLVVSQRVWTGSAPDLPFPPGENGAGTSHCPSRKTQPRLRTSRLIVWRFELPAGTTVGDAVTPDTTITWAGESFASLGLDQAFSTTPLVLFTLDNNETISAVLSTGGSGGVSAIPEPSSLLGLAGLMTASTFLRRRRPRS